jgi:NAD(P)-dependent dehydrogenase (short-subunit alcohol dehydrogenase family)
MPVSENRVAVVTGGASGIGLATAGLLAERGWDLVLADVEPGRLGEAVSNLSQRAEVIGVVTDVSDLTAVENLADRTWDRFGRADAVFNNAGVAVSGPIAEMTHADWKWVIDVDLWGPIHGVEVFLPRMLEDARGGHLLFTSSFAGLAPNLGLGVYCVAKYGVVAMAEVLHRELRPSGIGVSVLCPMRVATDIDNSDRNRPLELGGPGREHRPEEAEWDLKGVVLDVGVVAEKVVEAIGTDRLYIVPHEDSRAMIRRRFERIDRAFED